MEIPIETIEAIQQKRGRKKGNCKYEGGYLQHSKEIGYSKIYYHDNKTNIKCNLCALPVLKQCLKKHQLTARCLKNKVVLTQ